MRLPRTGCVMLCVAALAACEVSSIDSPSQHDLQTTLRLEADGTTGDLQYCTDDHDCQSLANPDACAVLVVVVDNVTGQSCETCKAADDQVIYERCAGTNVDCTVVTAPDPDCVVCAYVDGSVFYSSCTPSEPRNCTFAPHPSHPDADCRVCYDADGHVVLDECTDTCAGVVCAPVVCSDGYWPIRRPSECCPTCLPRDDCEQVVCTMEPRFVECPAGTELAREPTDCCSYYCKPFECPALPLHCVDEAGNSFCQEDAPACPPGFRRDYGFPNCGACVVADDTRYCLAEADCLDNEFCAVDDGCLVSDACRCSLQCDGAGICHEVCADCSCVGVCRARDWPCAEVVAPAPELCEGGRWQSSGHDPYGCPLPSVCVCPDGTISVDGECSVGACDAVRCPEFPDCGPNHHLEIGFPYCCGVCVPNDDCWTLADVCSDTVCGENEICEAGPYCEPMCVPTLQPCYSTRDCNADETCTTEYGQCSSTPGCDDPSGLMCVAACAGFCIPRQDEPPEPQMCMGRYECGSGFKCTTEDGDCESPPECADPNVMCPAVCYGFCEPLPDDSAPPQCEPIACGPFLDMPHVLCADGVTVGGPTGRCLRKDDGTCVWEIQDC